MKSRLVAWLVIGVLVVVAWLIWPRATKPAEDGAKDGRSAGRQWQPGSPAAAPQASKAKDRQQPEPSPMPSQSFRRMLEGVAERLRAATTAEESASILKELRAACRDAAGDPAAVAAILEFLKTGEDAPTRLPFVVGDGGVLEQAPSLRCALLDLLPGLDPDAALAAAREVMTRPDSPDEYALALRNLAWNDHEGDLRQELSARFGQMLATDAWLAAPSAGLLEALDVAVALGDPHAFDAMLQVQGGAAAQSSLGRAAFLALDRMVQRQPQLLTQAYAADPQLHGLTGDARASLMSRLEVTDPAQQQVLLSYLTAAESNHEELDYFVALFPNGNRWQGSGLVTTAEPVRSIQDQQAADRAALAEIGRLLATSPAPGVAARLEQVRARLQRGLGESPAGGQK